MKTRVITLAVKAKVLDGKRCAWGCPALDKQAPFGAECMRLWRGAQNTTLITDNDELPPLRCKACRESEIKE